jgi:hypothetical protein
MKNRISMLLFAMAASIPAMTFLGHMTQAQAEDATAKQMSDQLKTACQGDVDKLCSGITPGQGRVAACMDSKEDQLSSGCKTTWTQTKADISTRMDKAEVAFRQNCGSDVQKFCSDVPSGKGRVLDCLGQHQDGLSNSCKSFQAKLDKKLDKFFS